MRGLALILCLLALPAHGEDVVLGLSSDKVAITATFEGSEILIFGAVKREEPISEVPLDVVITVAGPSGPVLVRKKDRRLGIWINTESFRVDSAPSFYAVATTGPLSEVLSESSDIRYHISIPRAIRSVAAAAKVDGAEDFTEALIRVHRDQDSYQMKEGAVALDEQTLFRTSIRLPANLTEGNYRTRIFLTREGRVVSRLETSIEVRKVGIGRLLFNLSREQPFVYGLMSLAIAILAGWLASAAFGVLRRS